MCYVVVLLEGHLRGLCPLRTLRAATGPILFKNKIGIRYRSGFTISLKADCKLQGAKPRWGE